MEGGLASILVEHRIVLNPELFLTRCMVCNGKISELIKEEHEEETLREWGVYDEEKVPQELDLYYCEACYQVFWWSPVKTSSSVRAAEQADYLYQKMDELTNGRAINRTSSIVPLMEKAMIKSPAESTENGIKVDDDIKEVGSEKENEIIIKEKEEQQDNGEEEKETEEALCQSFNSYFDRILEHLKENQIPDFLSAFHSVHGEEPETTNYNDGFSGVLDYIFVDSLFPGEIVDCQVTPASKDQVIDEEKYNFNPPPNSKWPSDHFLLTCKIRINDE